MKKILCILLSAVLLLSLVACDSSEYQDAVSAMAWGEYQTAHEIFLTIPGYEDADTLASECVYRMAMEAFHAEDYETASAYFLEISEYKDAEEKARECSLTLGYQEAYALKEEIVQAVNERDEAKLCQMISKYLALEHSYEEIVADMNDFVIETIAALFVTPDYDNFLFLDRLIAMTQCHEDLLTNVGNRLMEFNAANEEQRTIAFLTGTWRRIDSTIASGMRMEISFTKENAYAMVLEDFSAAHDIIANAKYDWHRGSLKWNDIQIVDARHIKMETLWTACYYMLDVQYQYYTDGIAYLDYDGMRIISQSTGEDNPSWDEHASCDVYIKETAIHSVPDLSKNDFEIKLKETSEEFSSKDVNLNKWFSASNRLFYGNNNKNPLTTQRGITIGSTWMDVVEQYGYGRGNLYVESEDKIYKHLRNCWMIDEESGELVCDILSDQVDEFMEYRLEDTKQIIRFYFEDGIVSWICFFTEN